MTEDVRLHGGSGPSVSPPPARVEDAHGRGDTRSHGAAYAALDLGTNNCRLLIARVSSDGFRVIDSFSRIIRLGEGISTTGRISDAAISRAVGALGVVRRVGHCRSLLRALLGPGQLRGLTRPTAIP